MNAKTCHIFSQFLCNKSHKVFYIFRFSAEAFTKLWILCCNTYRTCIQITYTHHHTAHCYKRSCRKAEFFSAEKCCDCNITATHKLSVCLNTHTVTKSVHKKCLMCLCKAKFPWKSCIVDRASWCGTCSSVITGDQNCLCTGFCNTGRDSTDTSLRNQFDRNICIYI